MCTAPECSGAVLIYIQKMNAEILSEGYVICIVKKFSFNKEDHKLKLKIKYSGFRKIAKSKKNSF